MKSVTGGGTSGGEGVFLAVVYTWLKEFDLVAWTDRSAGIASPYTDFHDRTLGLAIMDKSNLIPDFMRWLHDHPDLGRILEFADKRFRPENPALFASSMKNALASTIGVTLKRTEWWKDNLARLEKSRQDGKTVKQVMNS